MLLILSCRAQHKISAFSENESLLCRDISDYSDTEIHEMVGQFKNISESLLKAYLLRVLCCCCLFVCLNCMHK